MLSPENMQRPILNAICAISNLILPENLWGTFISIRVINAKTAQEV